VNDDSDDEREFVPIEKFEAQFPPSLFLSSRRRDFYASNSNNKKIIEEANNEGIGGDKNVNIEENVEEIVEKVVEEVVRTRSNRKVKKAR
jgi:hypothetical protein